MAALCYLAAAGAATMIIWLKAAWPLLILQSGLMLAAAWLAAAGSGRSALPAALPFMACAGWGLVQLATGLSSHVYGTGAAYVFWSALAASALLCRWAAGSRDAAKLLDVAAGFAAAVTVLGVAQHFTSGGKFFWLWPSDSPDVFGPFQSRNNFASFVLLFLPYHLWRALSGGHAGSAVLAAVSAGAILTTGSRAGAALAGLECLAVLYRFRRNRTWALRLALLTVCAVGVGGWEVLGRKIHDHDPLRYRREMMQSAATLALERPLLGHGLGAFTTVYPSRALFDTGHFVNHAHNEWLQWAAEGGIPFGLGMLALAGYAIAGIRGAPWAIGLAAVAMHGIVDYPFVRFGLAVWIVTIAVAARGAESIKS